MSLVLNNRAQNSVEKAAVKSGHIVCCDLCLIILTKESIFKMNGYTFKGSKSAIYSFASLLNGNQLMKEKIFFLTHWTRISLSNGV